MSHFFKNNTWVFMMFAVLYIGSACQLDDNTQAPYSDDDASLRGHILDAHTATPLVGVQVSVGNDIVGFRHAMTDDTGWFLIEGCDADATTLIVDGRDIDSGHYSRITLILPHGQIVSHKKHTMPRPIYLPRVNKTQATLDLSNRLTPSEDPNHPAQDGWWQVNTRQPLVLTHKNFTIYRGTEPTRLRASASLTLAPESFIKFPHGDEPILSMTSVSPLRLPWSLPRHVAPDIMLALEPYGTEIYPPATLSFWDKNTTAPSPDDQHYSLFALTPKTNQLELKASFLPETQLLKRHTEQTLGATTAVSNPLSTGQQVPLLGFVSGPVCAPTNTDLKSYRIGISRYYHWDTTGSENNNQAVVFDRTVPSGVPTDGDEDYPHADIRSYDGLLQEREYSRENTIDYSELFGVLVEPYLTDHTASFPEIGSPLNNIVWGAPDNECHGTRDVDALPLSGENRLQSDTEHLKVCIILPSTDLYACAFDYTYYYREQKDIIHIDGVRTSLYPSALTSLSERSPTVTSNPDPAPHNKNFDAPPGGGVGQSWWRTSGYYDSEPYLLTLNYGTTNQTLIYPNIQRYDWAKQYDSLSPDITSASYRREREDYRNSSYGRYGICDDCCPTTQNTIPGNDYELYHDAPKTIGEIRFTNQPRNGLANRVPNVVTLERTGESVGLTGNKCSATCSNGRTSTRDPWSLPDRDNPDPSLECPDCSAGHITQMGTSFYMDFREWNTYREYEDEIVQSQGISRQCLPIGSTDPPTATELATEACNNGATWTGNFTSIDDINQFNTELVVNVDGTNRHYTKISGSITIKNNSSITAISLIRLCQITGSMHIQSNTSLTSISLPALTSVGSYVNISSMNALTSVSLPALTSVETYLVIRYMNNVISISLQSLMSVGTYFTIRNMDYLISVSLPRLESIGGSFSLISLLRVKSVILSQLTSVGNLLAISYLYRIQSLSFPALESIERTLSIDGVGYLKSLSFPVLTSIGRDFSPHGTYRLSSLSLPRLESIGGSLEFSNTHRLTSLSLSQLTSVGESFLISGMSGLTSLSLPLLTSVSQTLTLINLESLTSLSFPLLYTVRIIQFGTMHNLTSLSLPLLRTVGTNCFFQNMNSLTSFDVPSLTSVGYIFSLRNLPNLRSVSFPALTTIGGNFLYLLNTKSSPPQSLSMPALTSISGKISITNVHNLTSISLPELTSVGSSILFYNLSNLVEILMPKLTSANQYLKIIDTDALSALDLSALESIGNDFRIRNADSLKSLSLPELTTIGNDWRLNAMDSLRSINAPELTAISKTLDITSLQTLITISLPKLTFVADLKIYELKALTEVSLSNLIDTYYLTITDNSSLRILLLSYLSSVTRTFNISTNKSLCQSVVDNVIRYLRSPPASTSINNNRNGC